jgi:hypothetical protein
MDFLTSKRFVTTALVVLVMLNITLLGVIWWQNILVKNFRSVSVTTYYSRNFTSGPKLSLTENQKAVFSKLQREHFDQTRPEVAQIVALKKELVRESFKTTPDTARISMLVNQIGMHQSRIERNIALHFHELAKICNPAQRESLQVMLGKIYTRKYDHSLFRGNGRPHRGPHGDGPAGMPPPPAEPPHDRPMP